MAEKNKPSKPGEAALKNMQLLKSDSLVFKMPKIPKKKNRKTHVLDEDEYVEGIAKIIQRDFFPDLEKLKAQNDYLEATENKDYARLRELAKKYSGKMPTEPYNSPATFDTPGVTRQHTPSAYVEPQTNLKQPLKAPEEKDITENHTLDSFLAKHTSEDNASYDRVIDLENKKRASKLTTQLQAELTSAALVQSALALPSIEEQADQTKRPLELDTWKYRAKNFIMYVPDGAESQEPSAKPELQHCNTRLRTQPFDPLKNKEAISAIARNQDTSVKGKIGVDGVSISSEKPPEEYQLIGTPSPRPGIGPDQSPLMTWGEIEGTPFRLDGGDTPLPAAGAGAAFRVPAGGARERLALRLAARRRPPPSPRPFRISTDRLASMSPAARKLAAKHLLSPRLKLTPSDMGIFTNSTPKRMRTPKTPLVATKSSKDGTAVQSSTSTVEMENNNITDNLLQINVSKRTRLKAQDFFK